MHPNPRRIIPIVLVLAVAAVGVWYFTRPSAAQNGSLVASGTIEATQLRISPEVGGRIQAINAAEGETVQAGAALVTLDDTLLRSQRAQAEAGLKAARAAAQAAAAAHDAARANYDLLRAGPSAEQLAVAQTVVDRAQIAVDAAQDAYDALTELARDTTQGKQLKTQLDTAQATLDNARAQFELTQAGARPQQLEAAEAQVAATQAQADAAAAQAEAAEAARGVLDAQLAKLSIAAPADGTVLARASEPGEFVAPGATLLILADLSRLTITVFVPEDRYGQISLGQSATVAVDSFPDQTFTAAVTHIANQAEFTPRNVQTADGRKTTVFAIELSIGNPDGRLKPGMPADVSFGK
jgi:multidrug resistance efflux pump